MDYHHLHMDHHMIEKLLANPNKLSYEDMLKLEEEIDKGKVKGFTHTELAVSLKSFLTTFRKCILIPT